MRCYKCGCVLSAGDKCPQCGIDVSVFKKTAKVSNSYYNLGLAKARVRDLSGAAESLRTSIAINKYNIDARNLLGLVYCEMGDVVEALSEWVLSKNIKPEDNPASSYITQIQSNQSKFETVTNAIKKYNQSLKYAKEGNIDMAVIQLKKVVTQYPKHIKSMLLLSLLYIKNKEYNRAKKLLNNILKIDRNNTLAKLYLQEIEEDMQAKKKESQSTSFLPKKREKIEERKPLSGDDVIMPRSSYKEPSNGAITIVNILIGVAIGAALIWFLIIPSKYKGITADYNKSIQDYSEQLSSGNVELNSLESQLNQVKREKESLEEKLSQLSGDSGSNKLLTAVISAANEYIAKDYTKAAEELLDVEVSSLPTSEAKSLYNTIAEETMKSASTELYNKAKSAYDKLDYTEAADYYVKAYKCDTTMAEAAYYAAKCYVSLGQTENAVKYYQYIVDDFPSSSYYKEASAYVSSH